MLFVLNPHKLLKTMEKFKYASPPPRGTPPSALPSSPPPTLLTIIKMSNVCTTAQPVEEYIILPGQVAVMNVWDKFTAQSPRKLFRVGRAQIVRKRVRDRHREREREKEREWST